MKPNYNAESVFPKEKKGGKYRQIYPTRGGGPWTGLGVVPRPGRRGGYAFPFTVAQPIAQASMEGRGAQGETPPSVGSNTGTAGRSRRRGSRRAKKERTKRARPPR